VADFVGSRACTPTSWRVDRPRRKGS
jgi:hypothetical protein